MSKTLQLEIPVDIRKMAEQSLEHIKKAIDDYLQFTLRAVPGNVAGSSELINKIIGYAERNIANAFEFAQKLVQARDIQSLIAAQTEFVQAQMQAITDQSKDIREAASQSLVDSTKATDKGQPVILVQGVATTGWRSCTALNKGSTLAKPRWGVPSARLG
jgi:phasin family protein